nr:MAG TPA: hypothetical protein [Caudoviricetes sp.]
MPLRRPLSIQYEWMKSRPPFMQWVLDAHSSTIRRTVRVLGPLQLYLEK